MIKLKEARTIEQEYDQNYNSIPREIFDQIIAIDPKTNLENNFIGPAAKQFLLPKYIGGETDFLNDAENVSNALNTYMQNRSNYPQILRNIANFPSVDGFVKYINDGDTSSVEDILSNGVQSVKKNKIEDIYSKYYSALDKATFDSIIALDEKTNENSIGTIAKNLLLPKALKGELNFLNDIDKIKDCISKFYEEGSSYPYPYNTIDKYESVKDFIDYLSADAMSAAVAELKEKGIDTDKILYVSTPTYDVFLPTTFEESRAAAHTQGATNVWCTAGGDTGHTYSDNYWNTYFNGRDCHIFEFINKLEPKNKDKNFNLALRRSDNAVYEFRNGYNRTNNSYITDFKAFLIQYPELILALSKTPIFSNNPQVQELMLTVKYAEEPLVFKGMADPEYVQIIDNNINSLVKKVIVTNMNKIPAYAFVDFSALTEVELPDSLEIIGVGSFQNCQSLKDITLPKNLKEIKADAFSGDVALKKTLQLPDSLEIIGRGAFNDCPCKLSVNKNRTTPLHLSSADRAWYERHLQARNLSEEFDIDILDENLPPDLAKAYKNAERAGEDTIRQNPASAHKEIYWLTGNGRRNSKYDYGNANYEEISADEAMNRIQQNREDVNKLRAIYYSAGDTPYVAEWEHRNGSQIYNVYTAPISWNKQDRLQNELDYGTVQQGNTKYCNSLSKLSKMLQVADKIYWTDEYDHLITPETPLRTKKIIKVKNPETDKWEKQIINVPGEDILAKRSDARANNIAYTYVPTDDPRHELHNAGANYRPGWKQHLYKSNIPDTGSHTTKGYTDAFKELLKQKQQLFKDYNYARKYVDQVNKDITTENGYTDDEINNITNSALENRAETYHKYIECCDKLHKAKDHVIGMVDNLTAQSQTRIKMQLDELSAIQNKLFKNSEELTKMSRAKGASFSEQQQKLKELSSQAKKINDELQAKLAHKQQLLDELERLNNEISNTDIEKAQIQYKLDHLAETNAAVIDEFDARAEETISDKFKALDELVAQQSELIGELNDYRAKFNKAELTDKNKATGNLDTELTNIVSFDDEQSSDQTENSVD